jgi:diguanylate cyclase (GGDEF)-like protein
MSSDADRLRARDNDAHRERAWLFWAIILALTLALGATYPPTQLVGSTAGWATAAGLGALTAAYIVRLHRLGSRLTQAEALAGCLAGVVLTAAAQALAGGYRSPVELLFVLHVFGAAGTLTDRQRALHLGAVSLAVLAPLAYSHATAGRVLTALVYMVVLIIMAGFLLEYGRRLRLQRLALFEAEQAASQRAITDALTGLGNRRALEHELDAAAARAASGAPVTILYLDLDGFKAYNDRFGHSAGDALLQRLAAALRECLADRGHGFRLGGDEFCAVVDHPLSAGDALLHEVCEALSEQGSGFRIGPSCGVVRMPEDAADAAAALRLADERMYADKRSGRLAPAQELSRVLTCVLAERDGVARTAELELGALARTLAVRLGADAETADLVARAAELHNIGKIAIPEAILAKPGPLDHDEWSLVRQHPEIGERILASAPALEAVARLVRSSHERPDGAGYPDRLAGEQIPLGSRIVAVCAAYAAMLAEHPYRPALGPERARAELRQGIGRQFDGAVVSALLAELDGRANTRARAATSST